MSSVVVVGAQWGDEGKGKVVDFLARRADMVVRYQGGANAGHTVVAGGQEYKLHQVPSGILYPGKTCVIGNGVVVDPVALVAELDALRARGVEVDNLRLSDAAHVIFPYHKRLDELEEARRGAERIGTTLRGIGPAYMDKAARTGIRIADLLDDELLPPRLERALAEKNALFQGVYGADPLPLAPMLETYRAAADHLRPLVADTSLLVNEAIDAGRRVLFEGAQGTLLDLDHGTYPFVTSSHPVAGGACIGAGVGPNKIRYVLGVAKAYTSRVGDGPFPSELSDPAMVARIRERGREYGTATGRPRRVGWLDAVILRYAVRLSGMSGLAMAHLDTLAGLDPVRICVGYRHGGSVHREFPHGLRVLARCEPVYEELPGWPELPQDAERWTDLPAPARDYVAAVERHTGIPVVLLSVGRDRGRTIERQAVFAP